ncbi:hypothetical protein MRX96_000637 [Rhipicephalus microplus]
MFRHRLRKYSRIKQLRNTGALHSRPSAAAVGQRPSSKRRQPGVQQRERAESLLPISVQISRPSCFPTYPSAGEGVTAAALFWAPAAVDSLHAADRRCYRSLLLLLPRMPPQPTRRVHQHLSTATRSAACVCVAQSYTRADSLSIELHPALTCMYNMCRRARQVAAFATRNWTGTGEGYVCGPDFGLYSRSRTLSVSLRAITCAR